MDGLPLQGCILLEHAQLSYSAAIRAQGIPVCAVMTLPDGVEPGEDARRLCAELVAEAHTVAGAEVRVCIAIPAGGFYYQPYGELPFAAGVAYFHELTLSCAAQGADYVMIHRAKSMLQARAGVLGARAAGLPVMVSMEPIGDGDSLLGETDLLSAYAVLRLLGVAGFGYASSAAALQFPAFEQIAAVRNNIPLFSITGNLTGITVGDGADELFAGRVRRLTELGVSCVGIWGAGGHQLELMSKVLVNAEPVALPQCESLRQCDLWAANETQIYNLEENIEFGEPIDCRLDMTDEVLDAEKEPGRLLCIEVGDQDDAYAISVNNGNMDQAPVALLAQDEAALEAALFYYNGRAVVDSQCGLEPGRLHELAALYGALIL